MEQFPCTETCVLDMADTGPKTLKEVGDFLGFTRERARQLEEKAIEKLARRAPFILKMNPFDDENEE